MKPNPKAEVMRRALVTLLGKEEAKIAFRAAAQTNGGLSTAVLRSESAGWL